MSKSLAVRNIQTIDGRVFVSFSYADPAELPAQANMEIDFIDEADMRTQIGRLDELLGERGLCLMHLAITYLRQDGSLANLNQVLNKTLTLDPFAAQPLKIT